MIKTLDCGCKLLVSQKDSELELCAYHTTEMLITGNTFIEHNENTIHATRNSIDTSAFGISPFKVKPYD